MAEVYLSDSPDQYGLYDIDLLKSFYVMVQSQQTQQHLLEKAKLEERLKDNIEIAGQVPDLQMELESIKKQVQALTKEQL